MATGLLVTLTDIRKHTAMNGNIDSDKFVNFVKIAQDLHIQNLLGTDLIEEIQSQITTSGAPTGDYLTLTTTYIKPCLIHYAMMEFLPFGAYMISNKGIYKHSAEASETADKSEVDMLVEKERDLAQFYAQRLIDYLCNNSTLFPEYTTNSDGDMHPDRDGNFSGWFL